MLIFHMGWEQLHALLSTIINSSCQWIDIVLTKDKIRNFIDVVIDDSTQTDLLPQSCETQGFVAFDATQAKERNFYNWHPTKSILFLAIEVFGCLHKHADVFLHNYANVI